MVHVLLIPRQRCVEKSLGTDMEGIVTFAVIPAQQIPIFVEDVPLKFESEVTNRFRNTALLRRGRRP